MAFTEWGILGVFSNLGTRESTQSPRSAPFFSQREEQQAWKGIIFALVMLIPQMYLQPKSTQFQAEQLQVGCSHNFPQCSVLSAQPYLQVWAEGR